MNREVDGWGGCTGEDWGEHASQVKALGNEKENVQMKATHSSLSQSGTRDIIITTIQQARVADQLRKL